jgi:hypothetical protein
VLGDRSYFVKHHSDSTKKFFETDIFNMLEFLIDNKFVMFAGRVDQQTVGTPMGTICDNVATYKWKFHNGKIEIISFVVKFLFNRPSLLILRCRSRYEADLSVFVVFFISNSMG